MRVRTEHCDLARLGGVMRVFVARPTDEGRWPAIAFYSDIFQLTESTCRMAVRLAGYGFVVAAPEIYWRWEPPGRALVFDDAGRGRGMKLARRMRAADFDDDIAELLAHLRCREDVRPDDLGAIGFCLGGHVAFRAGFSPLVKAAACFYPTGLHDGVLGNDDAGSLARAQEIRGELLIVFGTEDPHTGKPQRTQIEASLQQAGIRFCVELFEAEHAFMRDVGPRYDPRASDDAFALATATYARAFGRSD